MVLAPSIHYFLASRTLAPCYPLAQIRDGTSDIIIPASLPQIHRLTCFTALWLCNASWCFILCVWMHSTSHASDVWMLVFVPASFMCSDSRQSKYKLHFVAICCLGFCHPWQTEAESIVVQQTPLSWPGSVHIPAQTHVSTRFCTCISSAYR